MHVKRTFEVPHPRTHVWALFQDVPRVATCIPGTHIIDDAGDGRYTGCVEIKLGPIAVTFEGEARHAVDPVQWCGTITGTGRDRGAGSRAKFITRYSVSETAGHTQVDVESELTLSGAVAQFGRTGLIEELTTRMLEQFAANLEVELGAAPARAGTATTPARRVGIGAILWSSVWGWVRTLLARLAGRGSKETL